MKRIIQTVRRVWQAAMRSRPTRPRLRRRLALAWCGLWLAIASTDGAAEQLSPAIPQRPFPGGVYINPETQSPRPNQRERTQTQAAAPAAVRNAEETGVPETRLQASAPPAEIDTRTYQLSENDLIAITVYQKPDLDARLRVAKDGTVNYWLLGNIPVGGKTVQEATRQIRDLLAKDYLVNPQVNVTIVEYARREFTILGEGVMRPGTYAIPEGKPLSIQQAIALAGGYKPGAKKTKVSVTRWVGGQKLDFTVDTTALARERNAKPFLILPDDLKPFTKVSFDMPTPNYHTPEEEEFSSTANLRNIWNTLIDRIWIVALCGCAAAFLSVLYLRHATPTYASKVVLQVEQDKPKIVNIESVQSENFSSLDFLKTVEQTLLSRSLFERVVDANNLQSDPRFVQQVPGESPSKAGLVSRLAGMIDVRLRPGTRLIDVRVEHANPELAAQVARSLIEEFTKQNREQQSFTSQEANEFLLGEAQRLEQQLRKSEEALQSFKERTKFLPADNQTSIVAQKLKEQLTQAKFDRFKIEMEYKQFERAQSKPAALLAIPTIASDPTVIQLQNNITAQQGEIARLEQRYKPKHPKMIEAQSQLAKWQSALLNAMINVGETLKSAYDNAVASEAALEKALQDEEFALIGDSKLATEHTRLAREVESDRALYQTFLNRMKETAVTKDLGISKIRVVQAAEVPESPVKPQRAMVLGGGIAAGLFVGIGLALMLGLLDSSLKSLDDAEEYLRMPALSTVPQIGSGQLDSTQLVMSQNSVLSGAESFRSLRTSLALLAEKNEQRICLFTSALPEEGKTFCSLNYAYALAQQGLRVLLIDCDLRRPAVEQCLCATQGELAGLSDFLTGRQTFKEIVYDTGINNFYFIPAGTHVPNPSELLAQNKFNEMIDEALNHFDRIVLDSAPVFGVSDTLLMARRVHTACLVVRACKTPRKKVLRAIQILQNAGAPLAGLVLNRLPANDRRNGNDPYYDYGYTSSKSESILPMLRIAKASTANQARASRQKA